MARFVEAEGETVDQAVDNALGELGITREQADVEVLEEEETKGFLGIKRSGRARVRVTVAPAPDAREFLREAAQKILDLMGLDGDADVADGEEGGLHVEMEGKKDDLGILIGRHGQTLEALQTILGVMANRVAQDRIRVTLDVEKYRERRREELKELAERVAQKAVSRGEPVVLRPMTPFERKVVHVALHDNPDVETYSDGEEPYRRITVEPVS